MQKLALTILALLIAVSGYAQAQKVKVSKKKAVAYHIVSYDVGIDLIVSCIHGGNLVIENSYGKVLYSLIKPEGPGMDMPNPSCLSLSKPKYLRKKNQLQIRSRLRMQGHIEYTTWLTLIYDPKSERFKEIYKD